MDLSRTDTDRLVKLLAACATLIDEYCKKPHQQDKARMCRFFIKKIKKKDEKSHSNSIRRKRKDNT